MISDNVQIWFCKDKDGNILTIDEVDKEKEDTYYCPICGSELIARQGEIMSHHFAHIDKSKCNNESIYHFWYKNKLLQQGDKFIVRADSDKEYICKEVLVEQTYKVGDKIYKPDLTVVCESGEIIYFEFDYTNKKKLQDYIDLWIELGNTVVEIDVKTLMNYKKDKSPVFKALWYEGKCFNIKKGEDELYYGTIGKHKENILRNTEMTKEKEELIKLDWLWNDIKKYKLGEVDIEHISNLIQSIEENRSREIVVNVLRKANCQQIIKDYVEFNKIKFQKFINEKLEDIDKNYKYELKIPHKLYDRIYEGVNVLFVHKDNNFYNHKINNFKDIENINELINILTHRKKIYNFKEEILAFSKNTFNYSEHANNIDEYDYPYLNYYISKCYPFYRLYLNNFNQAVYGDYIDINNINDIEEVKKYLINKSDMTNLLNNNEVLQINKLVKNIKQKYSTEDIRFIAEIKEGNYFILKIKYLNETRHVYNINKKDIKNIQNTCNKIQQEVNRIYNDIYTEVNIIKTIIQLNKKYKIQVKGNWQFKFDWNNRIKIWRNLNGYAINYLFSVSIVKYKLSKINLEEFKKEISDEISNYIRGSIYGGNS